MKILHYALGFPPYRTGGLTKFCIDLMLQQQRYGNQVALIWPGKMKAFNRRVSVKNRGLIKINNTKLQSFEIINPLPVSYDEGIRDFKAFTLDVDGREYETLLNTYNPEVIHIHTLMGIHKSFLIAAQKKKIRLVFTAHDFFPICPKVTMFREGNICDSLESCAKCGICNSTALSINKIKVLQSPIYRKLKNSRVVKILRKKHRDDYLDEKPSFNKSVGEIKDFKNLRKYYASLLEKMDMIHYNSTATKSIYEKFFDLPKNCVIAITHSDISDHRLLKKNLNDNLRIRYLGPNGSAKGFFLLKSALDQLWTEKQNFRLDIHFTPTKASPYMITHDRYSYQDLKEVFKDTDVLVAPSILYETFGFTVLEALSYGVPVIISETVGAKDILAQGTGIVIKGITSVKLYEVIRSLDNHKLREMNASIVASQRIIELSEMTNQIKRQCYTS